MNLTHSEIGLSVNDLAAEIAFLERFGFRNLGAITTNPAEHALLTDGEILIGLYATDFDAPVVRLYAEDVLATANDLVDKGIPLQQFPTQDGSNLEAAEAKSPANVPVLLYPLGTITLPTRSGEPNSKLGVFGELAVPVTDFDAEVQFWNALGFPVMGDVYEQPERWTIVGSKTLPVGLHQTDRFSDRALTFFSPIMGETLESLQREGLVLDWEGRDDQDRLAHGVAKSPKGYVYYMFTGDLTKW